jgi:hypothetical protein
MGRFFSKLSRRFFISSYLPPPLDSRGVMSVVDIDRLWRTSDKVVESMEPFEVLSAKLFTLIDTLTKQVVFLAVNISSAGTDTHNRTRNGNEEKSTRLRGKR